MPVARAQVARLAGVSPAVVSYVVNGGPRPVAPVTRDRVQAAIDKLGYRPNTAARALRGQRTRSMGLLVPDDGNPFFTELSRAIEDVAFERGHVLLVGNALGDVGREATYLRTFVDRQVDGVIVVSVQSRPELAIVTEAGIPVVVLDRVAASTGVSTVVADHAGGAGLGVDHLIAHGHRRVGCVAGPPSVASAAQRVDGWAASLRAAGLPTARSLVAAGPFSLAGGHEATRRLLSRRPRPTALFVSTDVQALGALRACRDLGLDVPGDVALVCFDGTAFARYSVPSLTVVQQPLEIVARLAVGRLLGSGDSAATPGDDVVQVDLVRRESCGCHPDRRT